MMGPGLIFDKSALQALSVDESVWLEAFFLTNVVPVFYVEVLADLEKEGTRGRTPEDVVGGLATKTPSNATPNVHHRQMILAELAGEKIELTLRAVIGGGDVRRSADGKVGLHINEFPEQAALLRWQSHDFVAVERLAAKRWRGELAGQDLSRKLDLVKDVLPDGRRFASLEQVKPFIDAFCARRDRSTIELAFDVLDVPDNYRRRFRSRWKIRHRPQFDRFAPYTAHVLKVDLLFYLGVSRSLISGDRASNRADMAYLYYLPFTTAFVSGDGLHQRTVPLFLHDKQSFIETKELKTGLRELDEYYQQLPEETKALGVMRFAVYPPPAMDNVITRLWDRHMHPDWRENAQRLAARLSEPRDEEAERQMVAELNERIDGAQVVTDEATSLGDDGPEYFLIQRRVRATKGKWRVVSEDAENAGSEG